MKFKSIRKKLISRVSATFAISFVIVLSLVAFMSAQNSQKNLKNTESNIRNALIAKGKTLANNNSQALKGMVEDNAFSAVVELVSSTVSEDVDIVYGIFMDAEKMAWVNATSENPEGSVEPGTIFNDEVSNWAHSIEKLEYKEYSRETERVLEFAAPVIVEEEVLGWIRYGITTSTMQKSLLDAQLQAQATLRNTISILALVGLLAVGAGYYFSKRIAFNITTPLNRLKDSADTIASGDYEEVVDVKTNDEIGLLATNFELMRTMIRKKMSDLAKLNSTGESLASCLEQTRTLEIVLRALHEQIGVSEGSVYLMNSEGELEVKGFYPPKTIPDKHQIRKFKVGSGIMGRSASLKEIVFVPDCSKDESYVDDGTELEGKALLCIPLLDDDIVIGVMNCSGYSKDIHFDDTDQEFAQAIARQLVITIKNIRMREVIEEQNRTLEEKVEERTSQLAEKTNDIAKMLAHMHQGLFTVMPNGVVHHEYASYLEHILSTKNIANRNFMDLLFGKSDLNSDSLDQVKVACDAIIGEDEMMFDFNAHLLVSEYQLDDNGQTKSLELDWDPIVLNGEVEKLMVTVRDVTELKKLQLQAMEQQRELEAIGQILSIPDVKFNEFISNAKELLAESQIEITQKAAKDENTIALVFRNIHTIKGNARTYGFSTITSTLHEVENYFDQLRKDTDSVWSIEEASNNVDLARTAIENYEQVATEKLGRAATSEASQGSNADLEEIFTLAKKYSNTEDSQNNFAQAIIKMLAEKVSFNFVDFIDEQKPAIESIAQQLGKPNPVIAVDAKGILINNAYRELFQNVFVHLLRNSVDHGIEQADTRLEKGKSEQGLIAISAVIEKNNLVIELKDDGAGLSLDLLKQKAIESNAIENSDIDDVDIARLIFASGLSTAKKISDVSGRGVGMDAVKSFLNKEGGEIDICLLGPSGTEGKRKFKFVISLPSKVCSLIDEKSGSSLEVI